jgi:hypothetical protein
MVRGARWYVVGSGVVLGAIVALSGCSTHWLAEREPWRREAEVACLNSGAVHEGPEKVRISPINGPGMCGADFPLKVSALGDTAPIGYDDDSLRPPGAIPNGASMPQRWPGASPSTTPQYSPPVDARPLPPVDGQMAAPYPPSPSPRYGAQPPPYQPRYPPPATRMLAQPGAPISLTPPGVADPDNDEPLPEQARPAPEFGIRDSYPGQPGYRTREAEPPPERQESVQEPPPPLGPARAPAVTGSVGPVEVKPAATLACPIVSALDRWIAEAVQPAAMRWFHQPVVEIKQISAYSCRGMNGNPNAHISEHAFGNALDIAAFILADGRKVVVQYGWNGKPEEAGFLHDVQGAACEQFTTVLAPGANVYHYNHIHVDLMRRASRRRICEPRAIPGDVVAERARARFAAQHGDPGVTGSIRKKSREGALGYAGENDGRLPLAIPGED